MQNRSGLAIHCVYSTGILPADRWKTSDVVLVATLVVIGTALRSYRVDTGLWYDEIVTLVESARAPLGQILTQYRNIAESRLSAS